MHRFYILICKGHIKCIYILFFVGGISKKQLVLYKNQTFMKLVTTYCSNNDEDISILAKQLLYSINEVINISENDVSLSIEENLQIKD